MSKTRKDPKAILKSFHASISNVVRNFVKKYRPKSDVSSDVRFKRQGVWFESVYALASDLQHVYRDIWFAHFLCGKALDEECECPAGSCQKLGLNSGIPPGSLTTRMLVSLFVKPITRQTKTPFCTWFPKKVLGKPEVFISHAWDSFPCYKAPHGYHGSLDIARKGCQEKFVWIDWVSYNQHRLIPSSIAADMKELIERIGHVDFILTKQPFFERLWCLWEMLAANETGAKIRVQRSTYSRMEIAILMDEDRIFPPEFSSVRDVKATKLRDTRLLLEAMVAKYGSIAEADKVIQTIIGPIQTKSEGLSNEEIAYLKEKEPWNFI